MPLQIVKPHPTWGQPLRALQTWKPAWKLPPWLHPRTLCQPAAVGPGQILPPLQPWVLPLVVPAPEEAAAVRQLRPLVVPANGKSGKGKVGKCFPTNACGCTRAITIACMNAIGR